MVNTSFLPCHLKQYEMWGTQQSEQTRNILTTSCLTTSIPCLQPAQAQSVQDSVKCTYEVVKEADLLDNSVVTNILVVVDIHPCQQTDNILSHRDQMQSRSTVSGLSHVIHYHKPVGSTGLNSETSDWLRVPSCQYCCQDMFQWYQCG